MFASSRKGVVLIASYILILVLIILGGAFLSRSINESRIARRQREFAQAFYLAEAGIDYALNRLRAGKTSGDKTDSLAELGNYNCSWNEIDGSSRWEAISTGTVGSINCTVRIELRPDTFARYLYFTDDEHYRWRWLRIPVWFITGDYLGGPLQTNSHLHISGDPAFSDSAFHYPVKAEDNFITYMNAGWPINSQATSNPPHDNPDFQEGIELGAERAPFPSKALDLRTAAVQGGYHFEASEANPAQILLNSDGTMTVTDARRTNENMALPDNGGVFVTGGDVEISGTLAGQLSIGTNRSIVITDNLTYNDDPRINPDSTDTLGLIAERNVVISENAPYDVEANASTMALGNSFTVENWWQGPAKGTLTVFGGIIQDYRGPVGTFDPATNTRLSGYSKDYQYDWRLMENPPPFYPTTGDYVIISWEEQ